MRRVARLGIVGLGDWGRNLARTFSGIRGVELCWLCDMGADVRERMQGRFPTARATGRYDDLLSDERLDAVAIATPSTTHAALVRRALDAGKHVFVEKPLAMSAADAGALAAVADARGLLLMTGHILLFHPGVMKMKELIETGELGDVLYLYGNRQNLGQVGRDENALWTLGTHDVSVLLYLLDRVPVSVSARGEAYLRRGVADVVFGHLRFDDGIAAHLHLSWLDPNKLRRMTVVGSKRMAVFDDMETERKVTVYDKSALPPRTDAYGEHVQVRSGDIRWPQIPAAEPLRLQCEYFAAALVDPGRLTVGTADAVNVVRVVAALQRSLELDGEPVELDAHRPRLRAVSGAATRDLTERSGWSELTRA